MSGGELTLTRSSGATGQRCGGDTRVPSTFSRGEEKLATTRKKKKQPEPDDIHLSDKLSLNISVLKLPDSYVSGCFNPTSASVEVHRVIAR